MSGETSVRRHDPANDAELDRFVLGHAHGTFFHRPAWGEFVRESFGHEPWTLVVRRGGALAGALPLFRVRRPFSGSSLVSVPYGVYGGIVADDPDAASALEDAARALAITLGAGHVELRQLHDPGGSRSSWPASDLYVTFLRDLPDDPDECLETIPRKSRASARQARDKHGMEFVAGRDLLDPFHRLFLVNKRSLGSPAFDRAFFARLVAKFGDDVLLHGVRMNGRVIATCLSFVFRDTLMPYYSGSEPGTERLGSMNFQYWQLMVDATKRGLGTFDFGRSRRGSGAFDFKEHMGFTPTPLSYRYFLPQGGAPPSVNPSNPKFEVVQEVWRRLPLSVVERLGPRLLKYLP